VLATVFLLWLSNGAVAEIKILCADFSVFPDNADLPNPLIVSGFTFKKVVATDKWLAHQIGNEIGLEFAPSGIIVELPVPVQKIDLRLGVFNAPVHIVATDRLGASKTLDSSHSDWTNLQLDGAGIVSLRLTEGGFEGALGKICVKVFMSGDL
jgi:hypothetical protein